MRGNTLGGFDRFRLPAALLVVAIHTGPLLSVSPLANDLLTDIWGRIAVPFFFAVSGWFLVPRLRREGVAAPEALSEKGPAALSPVRPALPAFEPL